MLQIYSQNYHLTSFYFCLVCVFVCVSFALFGLPNTLDESRPNGPPSVFGKHCKREGKKTPEQDFWNDREASLDGTDAEFLRRKDKVRSPTPSSRSFMSQWIPQASVQIMFYTRTHNPHPTLWSLAWTRHTHKHTQVCTGAHTKDYTPFPKIKYESSSYWSIWGTDFVNERKKTKIKPLSQINNIFSKPNPAKNRVLWVGFFVFFCLSLLSFLSCVP